MAKIGRPIEEINEPEPVPITIPEKMPDPVIEPTPVAPEPVRQPEKVPV